MELKLRVQNLRAFDKRLEHLPIVTRNYLSLNVEGFVLLWRSLMCVTLTSYWNWTTNGHRELRTLQNCCQIKDTHDCMQHAVCCMLHDMPNQTVFNNFKIKYFSRNTIKWNIPLGRETPTPHQKKYLTHL